MDVPDPVAEEICARQLAAWERRRIYSQTKSEIDDLLAAADLRRTADERAIRMWRATHPEKQMVLPDHADLCVWLLERLDSVQSSMAEMIAALEDLVALDNGDRACLWEFEQEFERARSALGAAKAKLEAPGVRVR